MKGYFLTTESYIRLGAFGGITLLYLVLRGLLPWSIGRIAQRFKIEETLITNLKGYVKTLLVLGYIIGVLDLFFSVPAIRHYADPVLEYPILDVEALKLSLTSLAKGGIAFYLMLVLTRILRNFVRIYLYYRSRGGDVVSTIDILVYNTTLVIIVMLSLSVMGISWKLLLPVAGALGIGIGFGVRDIASNFVSGFVILTSRTVKRGDWITLGSNFGKIVDIGIRTTTIRTIDNIDVIIPNAHLISNELINWSYTDNIVRIHVPVGVSYGSDVGLVRDTLLDVAKKLDHILDYPQPEARFLEFGDSSLNFELLVWVDLSKMKIPLVKSITNYAIWDAFKEKGIQIPFPQRDVWFKNELRIEGPVKSPDGGEDIQQREGKLPQ